MYRYLCRWHRFMCAIPTFLCLIYRFLCKRHNFLDEVQTLLCYVHRFLCKKSWKELIRVFYSCLAAQRMKIPVPWKPWLVLFAFIHLVLDLNREQNPYLSKYFIKEVVLNLILQAWWLFKSSWVEIRRVCGYGSIGFREWELGFSTYLLVQSMTPW